MERTPLQKAGRLSEVLGLRADGLLVKRDDLLGLGGGGNKVRKLAYSCGEAVNAGATVIVTTGAAQSNHARLTAAAGARLGLEVVLVLAGDEPVERQGNLLLDGLFGAEVVWAGGADLDGVAAAVVEERQRHERVFRIPFGGTSPSTAVGYAEAARELLEQQPRIEHVVVAVGSGGTMAGLVSVLGPARVLGVDCGAVPDARATVSDLLDRMGCRIDADALRLDISQVGSGYDELQPPTWEAMKLFARTEGLILDPVYSGRAAAGLIAAVRAGDITPGQCAVFLHTGGLPGLFGHELVRAQPESRFTADTAGSARA